MSSKRTILDLVAATEPLQIVTFTNRDLTGSSVSLLMEKDSGEELEILGTITDVGPPGIVTFQFTTGILTSGDHFVRFRITTSGNRERVPRKSMIYRVRPEVKI